VVIGPDGSRGVVAVSWSCRGHGAMMMVKRMSIAMPGRWFSDFIIAWTGF